MLILLFQMQPDQSISLSISDGGIHAHQRTFCQHAVCESRFNLSLIAIEQGMETWVTDAWLGWCRPLMHACVSHGLTACHGIEIDFIKCAKANAFVALSAQRLKSKLAGPAITLPSIQCCAIEEVSESFEATPCSAVPLGSKPLCCCATQELTHESDDFQEAMSAIGMPLM